MKVYKDGIYKTIKSEDYGVYLKRGFVKVTDEEKAEPIVEEVKVEPVIVKEEPKIEVEQEQEPEIKEEPVTPKSRRKKER